MPESIYDNWQAHGITLKDNKDNLGLSKFTIL